MSIHNVIPSLWTRVLEESISEKQTVANHVMRMGGEFSNWGDVLNIDVEKDISVKAFNPEAEVEPDNLLIIEHGAYYNFFVNDADRVQSDLVKIQDAMKTAAERLAVDSEQYLLSKICKAAGVRMKAKLPQTIEECSELIARVYSCMKQRHNSSAVVSVVVPVYLMEIMMGDKMLIYEKMNRFEKEDILSMRFMGIPVFASPDLQTEVVAMEDDAVWFAGKVTRLLPYRPEIGFCDGVKGLYLCGATVEKTEGVCVCELTLGGTEG